MHLLKEAVYRVKKFIDEHRHDDTRHHKSLPGEHKKKIAQCNGNEFDDVYGSGINFMPNIGVAVLNYLVICRRIIIRQATQRMLGEEPTITSLPPFPNMVNLTYSSVEPQDQNL